MYFDITIRSYMHILNHWIDRNPIYGDWSPGMNLHIPKYTDNLPLGSLTVSYITFRYFKLFPKYAVTCRLLDVHLTLSPPGIYILLIRPNNFFLFRDHGLFRSTRSLSAANRGLICSLLSALISAIFSGINQFDKLFLLKS